MGRTTVNNALRKSIARANKALLQELPFYNCRTLDGVLQPFNSLLKQTSRRSLEDLTSLFDLNLFKLNDQQNDVENDIDSYLVNKIPRPCYYTPESLKNNIRQKIFDRSSQ